MALFCEPQITTMLDSPHLKSLSQNLTHQLEIPAFDEQQTGEYIGECLNHAGLTGDFPFPPGTVQKIYRNSQGIAGKIQTLAQQALLDENSQFDQNKGLEMDNDIDALPVVDEVLDFNEEGEEVFPATATKQEKTGKALPIGRKFHSWQIGAVAAVLALLAGVLWLTSQFSDDTEPSIAEEIPLDITAEPAVPSTQQPIVQDPALFEEPTPPTGMTDAGSASENPAAVDQASQEVKPAAETSADPLEELVQSIEKNQHDLPGSNDAKHQLNDVTVQADKNGKTDTIKVDKTMTVQTEIPATVTEPTQESTVAVVEQAIETSVPHVQVNSRPAKPTIRHVSIPGIKDGSWLRTQKDSHILLQLMGTHDQQAFKKVLKEESLGNDIAWFTTVHDGKPWYVVVKGPFKDRAAATATISSLPADLKKRKPWPRTVASVKKAMDEAP